MPSRTVQFAPGNTNWNLVGYGGAAYATAAALNAANDTPFPRGKDPGMHPASIGGGESDVPKITLKCKAAAGGDGSEFFVVPGNSPGTTVPPTANFVGIPIDGDNQGYTINASGLYCLWIQLTASTDIVTLYYVQP